MYYLHTYIHTYIQYPSDPVRFTEEPLIIHWPEAMAMLKEAGHAVDTHTYIHFFKNANIHPYMYTYMYVYMYR